MSKKSLITAAVMAALGIACAVPANARELTVASTAPVGSPWAKWIESVKTKIEADSGGKLTLKLVMAGQAGSEEDTIKQAARGRLDMAMVSTTPLSLMAKEVALTISPYLWQSVKQGTCGIGKLDDVLDPLLVKSGVKALTWVDIGHRAIFSKTPAKVPGDLAGVKFRVEPQLAGVKFGKALRAAVVETPTYDAVPSLQTGAANAMDAGLIFTASAGMYKAAPQVTLTNHVRQFGAIVISNTLYNSLSIEEKGWLKQFKEMTPLMEKAFVGVEEALIEKMRKDPAATVYVPTADELAQWKKATANVLPDLAKEIGGQSPAVLNTIADAQKTCPI